MKLTQSFDANVFSAENLSVGYRNAKGGFRTIKENINFSARKGELIAVLGSNGIGKSTFLRTMVALQEVAGGSFSFFGKPFNEFSRKEFAKMLSFVSTEIINVPNMLVSELVTLGRFPHTHWLGKLTDQDIFHTDNALNLLNMTQFKHRFVNELSDGEKQRVMIARTLAQNTPLIVLDEPTAHLDLANKYLLINTLKELCTQHSKTIIFSTHDLNIALKSADKIWLFLPDALHEGAPEDLILKGVINTIFQSTEIFFNATTYDFELNKNTKETINLVGTAKYYELTARALQRIGYQISKNANKTIFINESANTISWQIDQNPQVYSLYELAQALQNKFLSL